jgi:hypothetical protein
MKKYVKLGDYLPELPRRAREFLSSKYKADKISLES